MPRMEQTDTGSLQGTEEESLEASSASLQDLEECEAAPTSRRQKVKEGVDYFKASQGGVSLGIECLILDGCQHQKSQNNSACCVPETSRSFVLQSFG